MSEELNRLYLIDSSTISMCLSLYRWAKFRKTKSGVKLHLRLVLCDQEIYPDKAIITPAKPADKTQMDNLVVVEKDALNVFDRGSWTTKSLTTTVQQAFVLYHDSSTMPLWRYLKNVK